MGLIVAAAFGSGDFWGGRASTKASTPAVLFVAQLCAVTGAFAVSLVVSADVGVRDIGFGAAAGAVNVFGIGLLYHALANNPASVVAPITAVVGAVVPVSWGLATGERPSGVVLTGIVLAIAAAGLVGLEPGAAKQRGLAKGAWLAMLSGFALGSSLVLYAETSEDSGQWPVFAARATALVVVGIAVLVLMRRASVTFPRGDAALLAVAAGVADIVATVMVLVAVRGELISVVAPVASLAPAFTVVLAYFVTGERIDGAQRIGLVLALAGLALVAAG